METVFTPVEIVPIRSLNDFANCLESLIKSSADAKKHLTMVSMTMPLFRDENKPLNRKIRAALSELSYAWTQGQTVWSEEHDDLFKRDVSVLHSHGQEYNRFVMSDDYKDENQEVVTYLEKELGFVPILTKVRSENTPSFDYVWPFIMTNGDSIIYIPHHDPEDDFYFGAQITIPFHPLMPNLKFVADRIKKIPEQIYELGGKSAILPKNFHSELNARMMMDMREAFQNFDFEKYIVLNGQIVTHEERDQIGEYFRKAEEAGKLSPDSWLISINKDSFSSL